MFPLSLDLSQNPKQSFRRLFSLGRAFTPVALCCAAGDFDFFAPASDALVSSPYGPYRGVSGGYWQFYMRASGGSRLFVDDSVVMDKWHTCCDEWRSDPVLILNVRRAQPSPAPLSQPPLTLACRAR